MAPFLPLAVAAVFLAIVAFVVGTFISSSHNDTLILVVAAIIGGYMALNIGANDVANNMGPAVGGKVITVLTAVLIAAVFESAGALLAGGDVVQTVAKGIVVPGEGLGVVNFRLLMLSALFAAALWINLATYLNAPVSTTHSIVGGVLGAGIAASGMAAVNWSMMSSIAASWVISPLLGAIIAGSLLFAIKSLILNTSDRLQGARKWMPVLYALMAAAFAAYMSTKGIKRLVKLDANAIMIISAIAGFLTYFLARPFLASRIAQLNNAKKDIYRLFNLPLIIGVALLSFAHGANDVANAIGPLAAIVSTLETDAGIASKAHVPLWVMTVGALGISFGLLLFGPRLIGTVGEKITRLNAPRAYCVALSSAITVLLATSLALPVSSTHIAIGAIFGVGFLREVLENPDKQKRRPGHKLNRTAREAFESMVLRSRRRLVRRQFAYSIAAAWIITVPASALLAAGLYYALQLL